jgi:hypothetical protein
VFAVDLCFSSSSNSLARVLFGEQCVKASLIRLRSRRGFQPRALVDNLIFPSVSRTKKGFGASLFLCS